MRSVQGRTGLQAETNRSMQWTGCLLGVPSLCTCLHFFDRRRSAQLRQLGDERCAGARLSLFHVRNEIREKDLRRSPSKRGASAEDCTARDVAPRGRSLGQWQIAHARNRTSDPVPTIIIERHLSSQHPVSRARVQRCQLQLSRTRVSSNSAHHGRSSTCAVITSTRVSLERTPCVKRACRFTCDNKRKMPSTKRPRHFGSKFMQKRVAQHELESRGIPRLLTLVITVEWQQDYLPGPRSREIRAE
eukprot:5210810-Pleurochrysis_carterae.AAC.1